MSVGVNTTTAGAKSGTVTLNYQSDGTGNGNSGLAAIAAGSQTIDVSGNVYRLASASAHAPEPVVIGNQRVGGTLTQALTLTNTAAADGFSEGLNASIGGATGTANANGGSFNVLAAGATNNSSLAVGVDTATSGAKSGTATITLASDGTGTSGFSALGIGTQTVNVSGNVYQLAAGQLTTAPLNFGTVQVGQTVAQTLSITNTATGAVGFVEDLNASFGSSSGTGAAQIGGTGSISGLLAGSTDATGMTVNVNTGTAGSINGAIAVNFFSAGAVAGISNGLGVLGVGSASYGVVGLIEAVGQVINQAAPVINTPTIDLGTVRVGSISPTQFVSVTNQATVAPQAALNASISASAPVTASGSFNLLAPGATNNTALQVGMNTSAAGVINSSAQVDFVSDASNVGGCGSSCQLVLGSQTVIVTGTVNNLANAIFEGLGGLGTLSGSGTAYTLDFGDLALGDIGGLLGAEVGVSNSVAGPADDLAGQFSNFNAGLFTLNGFNAFADLAAGQLARGFAIGIDTAGLGIGTYLGSVLLNPFSTLAGFDDIALNPITLAFRLSVISATEVPEPSTVMLLLGGLLFLYAARRRSRRRMV
jgi:hypothetical protein